MEKSLGRFLREDERIHHIDGNKTNNVISNLLLCSNAGNHKHIHYKMENLVFKLIQEGKAYYDKEEKEFKLI